MKKEGVMRKRILLFVIFLFLALCSNALAAQPLSGMVGWWPGDGNGNDIIGGHNGTLVNGTTFADGMLGQTFSFDGVDDYVDIGDISEVEGVQKVTWSVWISPDKSSVSYPVIGKYDSYTFPYPGGFIIGSWGDNKIAFFISDTSDNRLVAVTSNPVIGINKWQNIAAVFDGSQPNSTDKIKIYFNGVNQPLTFINTYGFSVIPETTKRLQLGRTRDSLGEEFFFGGCMDEVAVYNHVLSAEEIETYYYYTAGSIGKCKNHPPVANAGPDQTIEITLCAGASVTLDGSGSSDPDGDILTYMWSWKEGTATGSHPTVTLPYGTTTVTLTVNDAKGGTATDTVNISVADTTAPTLNVTVIPNLLWPPNHKYVKVIPTASMSDACVASTNVELVSVTSSEPDNGLGDGDTANDIVINADGTVSLRAERSGTGSGRIYTITYKATDIAGNSTTASAISVVPHNIGKK